jgi:hypothetical protein
VADGRVQFYDAFSRVENLDVKVFDDGDEDWLPTQRWIGSGGRGEAFGLARIACGLQHMQDDEQDCRIMYEIVMNRTARTSGVVGAARIQPGQELREACRAYGDCVARSWVGVEGPLADKGGELLAFEQGELLQKLRGTAEEKAARLQDEIDKMRAETETLTKALDSGAHEDDREHFEHLRELYRNAIRHYEAILEAAGQ